MIVLFPPRAFAWGGLVKGVRVLTLTDIHCHLMPKVDDGPSTVSEAKQLLQMEYEDGVRNIILTPHYREKMFEPDMKEILHYYKGMRGAAAKIAPDFKIYLGCEYHTNSNMTEELKLIFRKPVTRWTTRAAKSSRVLIFVALKPLLN